MAIPGPYDFDEMRELLLDWAGHTGEVLTLNHSQTSTASLAKMDSQKAPRR